MSALLTDNRIPITILWSPQDLDEIINTALERGLDPIEMMRQAILDALFA